MNFLNVFSIEFKMLEAITDMWYLETETVTWFMCYQFNNHFRKSTISWIFT